MTVLPYDDRHVAMTPDPIPDGAGVAWLAVRINGGGGWSVRSSRVMDETTISSWTPRAINRVGAYHYYSAYYDGMSPGEQFALKIHGTLTRPGPGGEPPPFDLTVTGRLEAPPYYVLPPKAVEPIHAKAEFTAYYQKTPQKSRWSSHLENGEWQNAGAGESKAFSENIAGWYEVKAEHVSEPYSDTVSLAFVALEQLQRGHWYPVQIVTPSAPAYVPAGQESWFGVTKTPADAAWPKDKPVWTATGAATIGFPNPVNRREAHVTFPAACETLDEPEWIEVECGNTLRGKVIVVGCEFKDTLVAEYAAWVAGGRHGSFYVRLKLRPENLTGRLSLMMRQGGQISRVWVREPQAGGDVGIEWDGTFEGSPVYWHAPIAMEATWTINDTDGARLTYARDDVVLLPRFLDLDIDTDGDGAVTDADEAGEINPGAFLAVNDDDDNGNGTPDKDEPGRVAGEDDLCRLVIQRVVPDGFAGTLTLTYPGNVAVYEQRDRADPVPSGAAFTQSQLPKDLWVEGTSPGAARITISASGGGSVSVTANVVGVDLDMDSDNDNGTSAPDRSDAEDLLEADTAQAGKILPINQNDDDEDGIPDFADGFNLRRLGGDYASGTNGEQFVPLVLEIAGLSSLADIRVRFDYSAATPSTMSRDDSRSFPLVYRANSDLVLADSKFKFYTYPDSSGGTLRIWTKPGSSPRNITADFVRSGNWYTPAELQFGSELKKTFYLEAVAVAANSPITCTAQRKVGASWVALASDKVLVTAVDANLSVNSDNDRDFMLDADDDAIEDQGNGFVFWPCRDTSAAVSAAGVVELMPLRFSVPQLLIDKGFTFHVRVDGGAGVSFYRNVSTTGTTIGYIRDATDGNGQVAQPRLFLLTADAPVTLSSTTQDFAVKFHGVGIYRLSFEVQGPGATGRMAADSVKVTVRKPEELYWYGSARGSQSATFDYPLESHASVQINRFPDVAQVGNDNRDATKDKHFLFIHGFNNDVDEARAWSDELYKRLYWTGYRDNYIGITWFGDEGPDWIPGVEAYNFDLDVENALHASPCLYRCIRTRMMSYWHVKSSDINIMAHSLGNLVMWDALRINAHLHPGSRLVNNVISTEAAVWPETFLPEAPVVYNAPGDDAITYDTDQLARHSWTYWFRQAGHEARSSAAYVYHSWVAQDNALYAMRFNDKLFRGMLVPGGREHYYRNNVNSYPHLREPTTLHDTPTLMLHGHRHLSWMGEYDRSDLNLPLGTQVHPEDGNGVESSTPYPSYGWQRTEHSDQKNRPIFLIYQWYKNIVKYGAQIP